MTVHSKDIERAMDWYNALNTEEKSKVIPHINQGDSRTIVDYWLKNIQSKRQAKKIRK